MYRCLNCGEEFEENKAIIIEYGVNALVGKVQLLGCYECESTNIQDIETGKIQN